MSALPPLTEQIRPSAWLVSVLSREQFLVQHCLDAGHRVVWLGPVVTEKMVERQEANGELFRAFFGQDEFRSLMESWLALRLWNRVRGEGQTG